MSGSLSHQQRWSEKASSPASSCSSLQDAFQRANIRYFLVSQAHAAPHALNVNYDESITVFKRRIVATQFRGAKPGTVLLRVYLAKNGHDWIRPGTPEYTSYVTGTEANPDTYFFCVPGRLKVGKCVRETNETDVVHFVVKRVDSKDHIELANRAISFHPVCSINNDEPFVLSEAKWGVVHSYYQDVMHLVTDPVPKHALLRINEVESFYACIAYCAWKHPAHGYWTRRERRRMVSDIVRQAAAMVGGAEVVAKYPVQGHQINASGTLDFVLRLGGVSIVNVKAKEADINQGLTQVLLGCEILTETEKQHVNWSVATIFSQWTFVRRTGKRIEMQTVGFDFDGKKQIFPVSHLEKILRIFYQILADARPLPLSSGGTALRCVVA